MKFTFFLLTIVILAGACGTPGAKTSDENQGTEITTNNMYSGEQVKQIALQDSLVSTEANQLFLNALDEYRNKKNLKKAKEGFVASILKFPTAKAYYELGNVQMDQKEYSEALKAYVMAEKLDYAPFSKVLYNIACVYSQLEDYEQSAWYIEYALQAGYANFDEMEKDEDLAKLKSERLWLYRMHRKRGIEGMSNPENLFWIQYQKQFPQVQLPFSISEKGLMASINESSHIAYDYEMYIPSMRNERFSRDVSKGFYSFAQLADKPNFVALIYITKEEFFEGSPLTYFVMTYSHEGKVIDKHLIAGRESFSDLLASVNFDKKLNFTLLYEETKYKNDPNDVGYENNPIVSKEKVKEEHWMIDANGLIKCLDAVVTDEESASIN